MKRVVRDSKYFLDNGYYKVDFNWTNMYRWREVHEWCRNTFGKENYSWTGSVFWFKNEKDAFLFTIAWGQ